MKKRSLLLLGMALLAFWFLNSSLSVHGYARLTKAFQTIPTRTPTSQANPTQQSTPEATQQPTDQATETSTTTATIVPSTGTHVPSPAIEPSLTVATTAEPAEQEAFPTGDESPDNQATPEAQIETQGNGDQSDETTTQPSCDEPPCLNPTPSGSNETTTPDTGSTFSESQGGPPEPPTPVTGSINGEPETDSQPPGNEDNLGLTWLLMIGIGLLVLGLFGVIVERRRRS